MAGIYIHIPFCKSRCIYCDFYSTTLLHLRQRYVDAVCKEIEQRGCDTTIETIYFGGGTPSQLSITQVKQILDTIHRHFLVSHSAEITLEANPDDINEEYLKDLRETGINRLSLGIQTFNPQRLQFLNRRHTANQAVQAVHTAQNCGFGNISIDLMFGFPDETIEEWQNDIRTALSLNIQHISAYCLMYEEGTMLTQMLQAHEVEEISEDLYMKMYNLLIDSLQDNGFVHYEISNFSKPGFPSRHNSSYWDGTPYYGFGAAAHSYDIETRSWNPSDIHIYIIGVENGELKPEVEQLDDKTRYNELVMTSLRTAKGLSLNLIEDKFGRKQYDYCLQMAKKHIDNGTLQLSDNNIIKLTRKGVFTSDSIMSDMMS